MAAIVGLLVTVAIFESDVSPEPIYAPLIAAVALTAWYGGYGPSALAIALCWIAALGLLVEPRGRVTLGDTDDMVRWWLNLMVAIVVAGVGELLRVRETKSVVEARTARAAAGEIEAVQELTAALSGALSSADVSRAVSSHAPAILSASGVALGMVEGDELVITNPVGLAAQVRVHGNRLGLQQSTLLTQAVREGDIVVASDRVSLDVAHGRSSELLPREVQGAIAVPLRAEGEVVGSIGFLFHRPDGVTDETQALARIVAALAGQALERARLYDVEREFRRALERILQVAPRFLAGETEDAIGVICREARTTFGADVSVLWRVRAGMLELLAMDPPRPDIAGGRLPLDDFPRLREAIQGLGSSFVSDALETTHGEGLDFVRQVGIRSSLRTPIVISGVSELVLSISWDAVVSEPDATTLAVVRRFADQAGLALEQLERRRAEAKAAARADATHRLQEVTAALSQAATTLDVSNVCLAHALASIGAEAGFVVLNGPEGTATVELVASSGYDDDELEAWRALGLDADVPFARAMKSGEPVWALTSGEMSAFTGASEARSTGWVAVPLRTSAGARGALHLSLRTSKTITDEQREWVQAMVAQCGQALERSGLYEREQRSRRRAERLQGMTGLLSNALTPTDVANVIVDEVGAAVDATTVGLAEVRERDVTGVLAPHANGDGAITAVFDGALDTDTPAGRAIRERRSLLLESADAIRREFPKLGRRLESVGCETLLIVPLIAARRVNGLLLAVWDAPHQLAADDRAIVEALAGQAAQALDRANLFESERTIAETLQRSVLPVSLPRVEGVQLAARYLPGSAQLNVGGDWFDALQLHDGTLGLVVGDVVGKGVQAAASMAQLRNAIRAFSVERLKPSSALARLNRLADDVLDTSFATVLYLVLDTEKGVCKLSSAGHPPPVVAYPDGRVLLIEEARGLPLGTGIDAKYRQETIDLPAGSVIVLYTDGLVERRGRSIDDGLTDLKVAVAEASKDPDRLLEHILDRLVGSGEREDDIAVLAARVFPVAPRALELRVSSHTRSMDMVRDAMRTWLEGVPFDAATSEDVVLATWEACANAIEHARNPTDEVVTVWAELDDSAVRVVVTDTGSWSTPSTREDRGLGLRLIASLVSSVDVTQGDGGTTITMERAIATEPPMAG